MPQGLSFTIQDHIHPMQAGVIWIVPTTTRAAKERSSQQIDAQATAALTTS